MNPVFKTRLPHRALHPVVALVWIFGLGVNFSAVAAGVGMVPEDAEVNRGARSHLLKDDTVGIVSGWSPDTAPGLRNIAAAVDAFGLPCADPPKPVSSGCDLCRSTEPAVPSNRDVQVLGLPVAPSALVPEPSGQVALVALGFACLLARRWLH